MICNSSVILYGINMLQFMSLLADSFSAVCYYTLTFLQDVFCLTLVIS